MSGLQYRVAREGDYGQYRVTQQRRASERRDSYSSNQSYNTVASDDRYRKGRYDWSVWVWGGVKNITFLLWPGLLVFSAYLPGQLNDASRNLLVAAAVIWFVGAFAVLGLESANYGGVKAVKTWWLIPIMFAFALGFTIFAYWKGIEPCEDCSATPGPIDVIDP